MPAATQLPFVEAAVIADGVPVDELYLVDLDRAFSASDRIKPHVVKWWEAGAPVAIQWNEGRLARDAMAIIKWAKNRENALKFCAFATLPAPQARFSMQIPYGFVNAGAAELIPEAILAQLPTSPEILPKLFLRDEVWWAENRNAVLERWNEWILE
jgi:putative spermidine/putrescine transport system substrate-binding protein